jgi:glutaredoxin
MVTDIKNIIGILVVIVILLYIICKCMPETETSGESSRINKLKGLEVMFVKMSTCPYCIKMESLLLSKNLLHYMYVIDIQTNDGKKIAQENQLSGFPSFVSKKTGKKTSGYTEDIDNLLRNLE